MSVLPSFSDREVSGPLSSDDPPPVFTDANAHPILKFITGTNDVKQNQLLLSPHVEGVILVQNSKIVVLYLPRITYDSITDPAEADPILLGVAGTFCATAIPSSIDLHKVLKNFLILSEKPAAATDIPFPSGQVFDPKYFADHPNKAQNAIPATSYTSTVCVSVPLVIPKLRGFNIVEGSVTNSAVVESFRSYHPVALSWLQYHISHNANKLSHTNYQTLQTLDDKLIPLNTTQTSLTTTPHLHLNVLYESDQDTSLLRNQINKALQQKIALNTRKFHSSNTTDLSSHSVHNQSSHTPLGDISFDAPSLQDSFSIGGTSIDGKYRRPINTWRLFLASVGDDGTITLPTFTDAFLEGYSSNTTSENTRTLNSSMREHDRARSLNTRDYLHKLITDTQWNNATTALFLNGVIFDSQLDEFDTYLQASISFLTFLPNPHASVSQDIQSFLQKTTVENLEDLVGESNEKKRKINLKTFQGGLQETPTHVLTGLANLESKFSFMVEYGNLPSTKKQPLFVQWLNNLANIYSSRDFNRFYEKHKKSLPWITHTMVTQVQIIFSLTARVAKSYTNHTALKKDDSLPPSIFKTAHKAYTDIIADIERAYSGASLGCFATPPASYVPPPDNLPQRARTLAPPHLNTPSRFSSHQSRPTRRRGWIHATGPYRWPKLQCGFLCNKFAQVESQCQDPQCSLKHLVFPHSFSDTDKRTIYDFVTSNNNVSFAEHIRYTPSAPRLPSALRNNQSNTLNPTSSTNNNRDDNPSSQTPLVTQ